MGRLGFSSLRADPDVWFSLSKRSTGEEYYEYVLLYVDDVLVISEKGKLWYPVRYQRSLMRLQLKQATKDKLEGAEVDGLK